MVNLLFFPSDCKDTAIATSKRSPFLKTMRKDWGDRSVLAEEEGVPSM